MGRARCREERSVNRVPLGKSDGKNRAEYLNRRLEDNTKTGLQEIGWEGVGWINVAQDMEE